MSNSLVKYEAARYALQVASKVDEVKDIRDKALAMAAYARQAKDDDLIKWATDIKLRAERRAGEMLADTDKNEGGNPKLIPTATPGDAVRMPTLKELGLSDHQSQDFQAIAAIPEEKFEKALATGKATTKSLARASPKTKPKQAAAMKVKQAKSAKPETVPKATFDALKAKYDAMVIECEGLRENCEDLGDELKTCQAIRSGEAAKEMTKLRGDFKIVSRRRDELMLNSAQLMKEATRWRARAEKAEKRL